MHLRLITIAMISSCLASAQPSSKTFCNPLNLDYRVRQIKGVWSRHGADPVVILYKNRYYLFSTWELPGYRVSDDLVNWKAISFAAPSEIVGKQYTAAAVNQIGDWLYYTEFGKADKPVAMYRTQDPDSGKWEKCSDLLPPYADPCLFVDPPTKKIYMYYGLEKPIFGVELDPNNAFKEVEGTKKQLMPAVDPNAHPADGWEVCTWDNNEASKGMRGKGGFNPCREGSWMTFFNGKYYLQYASPGTTVPGYADGLLMGDSPLGPFTYSQQSPISQKDSGFITSAGHSCLFQDRYGNWWRAVTMLIGVHERMERRIGLFPAGFDKDGIPFTRTDLGDLPITLPAGPRDPAGEIHPGWYVISENKPVTASSSLEDHAEKLAADEDIRTWWSAKTGDAGEWLKIDLGKVMDVRAVQVNFIEQDYQGSDKIENDYHRFTVSASRDGKEWGQIVDRSKNDVASPHTYVQLDQPTPARYLKVENIFTPGNAKFAVSDFRIFGINDGNVPAPTEYLKATRDPNDRRIVRLAWKPADGASSYLIRYGIDPAKLYHHYLVRGGESKELTMYSLNHEPGYYFRIDSLNDSGVTSGAETTEAP
ncbi:MAG TPA: family 43 glycosylhydrolase [Tepidisphaeraceae bacterium]|nr:family 43 glycosylhydrolase [Tepidisphaeraceae bacterium]